MINELGLYVQNNFDVGDASHRSGTAIAILGMLGEKEKALQLSFNTTYHLETNGIYIRHPKGFLPDWSDNPKAFSRDQASRLMLGYAVLGQKDKIKRWFKQMLSRKLFHQNDLDPVTHEKKIPDILAPGEVRNLIRGLDLWYMYPALLALDILFIPDIYLRSKWDGSSLITPDIYYATKKYPTPFSYLAKFLLKKTNALQEALNNHSPEKNGCVELQELFIRMDKEL